MALAPWTALYTPVHQNLMLQHKEPELLLLLAISGHCDPFGFCFPGRKTLLRLRHCSKAKLLEREAWLQENAYLQIVETWDYRRRQMQIDYQVSPCVIYIRPELQAYCEAVFTGQERDYSFETMTLGNLFSTKDSLEFAQGNLFSTKDSQPEEPESETRIRRQNQKPDSATSPTTRHHNQLSPSTNSVPTPVRLRESESVQRKALQPTAVQNRKNTPQAGPDEFDALLDADDDRMAKEIELGVGTTPHQAAQAVADYPRELLIEWLRKTVQRRAKGQLAKPGGWFFKMVAKNHQLIALQPGNPDSVVPYDAEMEI